MKKILSKVIGKNLKGEEQYKHIVCLSAYDHWLTEEEADEQILAYPILKAHNKQRYFEREEKFINFYKKIYNAYSVFLTFRNAPKTIYEIESQDELVKICIKSIREESFTNFYLKEIDLLISGSFDLNVLFYTNNLSIIKKLQKENFIEGLYLLY